MNRIGGDLMPAYAGEQSILGDAGSVCGSLKGRLESDLAELNNRVQKRSDKLTTLHNEQTADEEAIRCINNAIDDINGFFGPKSTSGMDRPYK